MAANATNYVYLNPASNSCVPAANTTGFSIGHIPIAIAGTGASSITTLTDVRNWFSSVPCTIGSAGSVTCASLGTNQDINLIPQGTGNVLIKRLNNIRYANQFTGVNAGQQIQACIDDLPSTGGICDARGFVGNQTISNALTVGTSTKPVVLYLGLGTYIIDQPITLSAGSQLIGSGSGTVIQSSLSCAVDLNPPSCCPYRDGGTAAPGSSIIVAGQRVVLADFTLAYADSATEGDCSTQGSRCSIGINIGVADLGHHVTVRNVEVTRVFNQNLPNKPGFSIGLRIQKTFYGGFYNVDAHTNKSYNWLITNEAISDDYYNVRSRGEGITEVGIRIDDTIKNSSEQRFHGGTFEGAKIQQLDIVGADYTLLTGTHLEALQPAPLTGLVTLTKGSTSMTGNANAIFTQEIKEGQYVRLNDPVPPDTNNPPEPYAWMRVKRIIDDRNAELSDPYQGRTGVDKPASVVAGNIRVVKGDATGSKAIRNLFVNPALGVGGENFSAPGIYIQSGEDNGAEFGGDPSLALIFGTDALRSRANATLYSGGIVDIGKDSVVLGDLRGGNNYAKVDDLKTYDLRINPTETSFQGRKPWTFYINNAMDQAVLYLKITTTGIESPQVPITATRLISTIVDPTPGFPPIVVSSVEPIPNLTAVRHPVTYDKSGNQQAGARMIIGKETLGGTGSVTVDIATAVQFTSTTSYFCVATDRTAINPVKVTIITRSQFTISGTANDDVSFVCVGN
ncbi:MAG: hypothetical protein HYR55_18290 [Acidobacteria bacterium]|nr:hypothetical protein [Acidobacteriota bacterium]MBI3657871.1 hypothetical protein [Acidobacteriota bacterium]